MPKFHRIVCGLCFCSAALERRFWERGEGASFGAGAGGYGLKSFATECEFSTTIKVELCTESTQESW